MRPLKFWIGGGLLIGLAIGGCRRDEVRGMIHRLSHGSPEGRIAAAQRLTTLRAEAAKEPLLKALRSEDPALRHVVAEGLLRWGDETLHRAAVETLREDLTRPNPEVQSRALRLLGDVETPSATEALLLALQSPYPPVRERAAKTLWTRGVPLSEDDALRRDLILGRIGEAAARGKKALPLLSALLQADATARAQAAQAIGLIGESRTVQQAVTLMLADLKSPDPSTRARASSALGALGDRSALAPLQNLAQNDNDPRVRASAKVAASILQKDLVSLIRTLSEPDPDLQTVAVWGVRHIPPKERATAVEPLIRLLRTTIHPRLAAEVIAALGACGAAATQPLLAALGQEPEWELRMRLVAALAQPRVRAALTRNMEETLYSLYEKEVHDAVKNELGRLLKALES